MENKKRRCPHKRTGRAARRFTSEEVAKEIASAFFSAIVQKATHDICPKD